MSADALCPWCSTPEAGHSPERLAAGHRFARALPTLAYDPDFARGWIRRTPITPTSREQTQ